MGCDSGSGEHFNLKKASCQAYAAPDYAIHSYGYIAFFDCLGLEYLVAKIPEAVKQGYEQNIFRDIPKDKTEEYLQIIKAYFKYNGSIQKMSEELYLHKNTLQYKLRKLAEYTGRDIRTIYSSAEFLIAMIIREEKGEKVQEQFIKRE